MEKVLFTGCGDLESELLALGLDTIGAAVPFATGLGMAARLGSKADNVLKLVGHGDDIGRGSLRLLTVGESSFEYSLKLWDKYHDLGILDEIVATSYQSFDELAELGFKIPRNKPGFTVLDNIDARNLGQYFDPDSFDTIIFNNPRADKWGQGAAGDLIQDLLNNAPDVLRSNGQVHIGVLNPQGLGKFRLDDFLKKGGYGAFDALGKVNYDDYDFAVDYVIRRSEGGALGRITQDMSWYIFQLLSK